MFRCTFCGHETKERQGFRRHLTGRHDADYRREKQGDGNYKDVVVLLQGEELVSRIAALKRGQRHVRRRRVAENHQEVVTPTPESRDVRRVVGPLLQQQSLCSQRQGCCGWEQPPRRCRPRWRLCHQWRRRRETAHQLISIQLCLNSCRCHRVMILVWA
jgi:hypothetical protein